MLLRILLVNWGLGGVMPFGFIAFSFVTLIRCEFQQSESLLCQIAIEMEMLWETWLVPCPVHSTKKRMVLSLSSQGRPRIDRNENLGFVSHHAASPLLTCVKLCRSLCSPAAHPATLTPGLPVPPRRPPLVLRRDLERPPPVATARKRP